MTECKCDDPWAGAPKGIRVYNPTVKYGVERRILTEDNKVVDIEGKFADGCDDYSLQEAVKAYRAVRAWQFVDFDGKPEGIRFYYKSCDEWNPAVVVKDKVHYRHHGGAWNVLPVEGCGYYGSLEWFKGAYNGVVMVDEEPVKPAPLKTEDELIAAYGDADSSIAAQERLRKPKVTYFGTTAEVPDASMSFERHFSNYWQYGIETPVVPVVKYPPDHQPEIRPNDVIRDTTSGRTWMFVEAMRRGTVRRTWQQVGEGVSTKARVLAEDEFKIPARYKIVSRAV